MISKETKLEEFDEKIFIFNRTNSRAKSIRSQNVQILLCLLSDRKKEEEEEKPNSLTGLFKAFPYPTRKF